MPALFPDRGAEGESDQLMGSLITPLLQESKNSSILDLIDFLSRSASNVTFQQDPLYNDTLLVVTENPFDLLPVRRNTPLTAPESDLVTAKNDDVMDWMLGSGSTSGTDALYWLIPVVIGVVGLFIILGLLLYYGVRMLELRMIRCCRKNCFWCCCFGDEQGETVALTRENLVNPTELREYRSNSSAAINWDDL